MFMNFHCNLYKQCDFIALFRELSDRPSYVCNIPAKYQMNIPKALGGVDFTKYTLLPISQYVQWSKIG